MIIFTLKLILLAVRAELALRQSQGSRISADRGELVEPQAQGERREKL